MAHALECADAANVQIRAVHNRGIHFSFAFGIEFRTGARIECRIVFQNPNCGFHGFYGAAATLQNHPARVCGVKTSLTMRVFLSFGNWMRAAMHNDGRLRPSKMGFMIHKKEPQAIH
jgi:hypothetical protein